MKRLANIENFEMIANSSNNVGAVWNGYSREEIMPGGSARKYFTTTERGFIDRTLEKSDGDSTPWANPGLSTSLMSVLFSETNKGLVIDGLDDVVADSYIGEENEEHALQSIMGWCRAGRIQPSTAVELVRLWGPTFIFDRETDTTVGDMVGYCIRKVPEEEILNAIRTNGWQNAGPALEELYSKYGG